MKELKDYRRWTWNCFRDSQCKQVFPWHTKNAEFYQICPSISRYKFDCYAAQGKMDIARALIEGELDWSDSMLEVIYQDPLCGACDYICGRIKEMQPTQIIQAMRAKALKDGLNPPGGFKTFLDDLREYMNPYRKHDAERINWMKGLPASLADGISSTGTKTKNLLYVGCFPLRDPSAEKMAQDAATVLIKADVDVGILGEKERCCGNPSLRMGDVDSFHAFAKENIKMFNDMGIEKLVTICPFCYSTFTRDYPMVDEKMNFEVIHILDMVDELIAQGKLKLTKPVNLNVTYHDPCHLGRISDYGISGTGAFSGIYEPPRNILNSIPGITLTEMDRNRDDSWCCGAGSWLRDGYLELAQWTADKRIEEAESTGAEALVTYCPHCEENLGEAIQRNGNKMQMYDLLDLVLQAL